MEVCRKCGAPLKDGDRFCSKCGAKVRRPSSRYEERQKKKEQKKVTFRTSPEKDTGYREHFEEGENRRSALTLTALLLMIMAACVAVFAFFFFYTGSRKTGDDILILSGPENAGEGSGSELLQADAEEAAGAAPEAAEPAETALSAQEPESAAAAQQEAAGITPGEDAGGGNTDGEKESGALTDAGSESALEEKQKEEKRPAASETEETEIETETETEPQTEAPSPSAADVIDPARLESEIASGSTASQYEIYIYDLKHDSEAALGDCSESMYASALITVPILYTAASLIDDGTLSMDTQVTYEASIGGRGEYTTEARNGLDFPLSFFLQTMAHYSDNNCINTLIDYLTLDTINSVSREAGYQSVNLERKLVNGDTRGLDNYISARDISLMVRDLYKGKFRSVDAAWMEEYFHIDAGDSLPTLFGLAPGLKDAVVLNQNGHGDTRYNETALIRSGNSVYVLTAMLYGSAGFSYNPAVTNIADYVNAVMTEEPAEGN